MSLGLYFLIFALLSGLVIFPPRSRIVNAVLLVALFIALLVPAFRLEGIDRDLYLDAMDNPNIIAEQSFEQICSFASILSDQKEMVFGVYGFLALAFVFSAIISFNRLPWACILVYFSQNYVIKEMIQIRGGLSVGAFLLAACMWFKFRKYGKFNRLSVAIFSMGVSIWAHISATMMPFFLFLRERVGDNKRYGLLLLACIILGFFGFDIVSLLQQIPVSRFQSAFERYVVAMNAGLELDFHAMGVRYFARCVMFFVMLFWWNRIKRFSYTSSLLMKIYCASLCVEPLMSSMPSVCGRTAEYLASVEVLLIPTFACVVGRRFRAFWVIGYSAVNCYLQLYRSGLIPIGNMP